ncbi:MAG: hypothetical protein JXR40_08890 [Pontiellaceae bacterium]|nr:hypothetical protein [Pontiellaceae bacterium]
MKYLYITVSVVCLLMVELAYGEIEWTDEGFYNRKDVEWLLEYWDIKLSGSQTVHANEIFSEESLSQLFDMHVKSSESNLSREERAYKEYDVFSRSGEKVLSVLILTSNSYEDGIKNFLIGLCSVNMRVQDMVELYVQQNNGIGDFCMSSPGRILESGGTNRNFFAIRDNVSITLNPVSDEINVERMLRNMDQILLAKASEKRSAVHNAQVSLTNQTVVPDVTYCKTGENVDKPDVSGVDTSCDDQSMDKNGHLLWWLTLGAVVTILVVKKIKGSSRQ